MTAASAIASQELRSGSVNRSVLKHAVTAGAIAPTRTSVPGRLFLPRHLSLQPFGIAGDLHKRHGQRRRDSAHCALVRFRFGSLDADEVGGGQVGAVSQLLKRQARCLQVVDEDGGEGALPLLGGPVVRRRHCVGNLWGAPAGERTPFDCQEG